MKMTGINKGDLLPKPRPLDVETFTTVHGHAAVQVEHPHLGCLVLVFTAPDDRGRGHGTALLAEVHTWADRYRRHLYAAVLPLDEEHGGLDATSLHAWYQRHGWIRLGDSDLIVRVCENAPESGMLHLATVLT